jgi:putative transposase
VSDVYEFIDAEYASSPAAPAIARMCAWLEVSKSGYYEWRSRPESATAKRREELKLLIAKAFEDSDARTGTGGSGRSFPAGACGPAWNWSAP